MWRRMQKSEIKSEGDWAIEREREREREYVLVAGEESVITATTSRMGWVVGGGEMLLVVLAVLCLME